MKNIKMIARVKVLITRLSEGSQVTTRELKTVMTASELIELEKSWADEMSMGIVDKPSEIVKYGELLKTACMYYGKMEYHHTGRRKNARLSRIFSDKADSAFERAIEYIRDMVSTDRELAIWLDRDVFKETSYSPIGIPRIVGSNSYECLSRNRKPYRSMTKRDLKISFLEKKLDELKGNTLEAFMEVESFHIHPKKVRNLDFSSFKF